jgi:hypothetical protein
VPKSEQVEYMQYSYIKAITYMGTMTTKKDKVISVDLNVNNEIHNYNAVSGYEDDVKRIFRITINNKFE